jgi:hypothetical protein
MVWCVVCGGGGVWWGWCVVCWCVGCGVWCAGMWCVGCYPTGEEKQVLALEVTFGLS